MDRMFPETSFTRGKNQNYFCEVWYNNLLTIITIIPNNQLWVGGTEKNFQ